MLTKDKGMDPTGEVLWGPYNHAKRHELIEKQHHCHHQELEAERIQRPFQLVLELQELPAFWCPHERRPEGGFLNNRFGDT